MPLLDTLKATVTIGGTEQTAYFSGNANVYGAAVAAAVGVMVAPMAEQSRPRTSVQELQGAGWLIRLTATLANNKGREILCSRDKLTTALDELIGKGCDGSTINSVRVARKAVYY
jgi:hypothetical protein